MKSSDLYWLAGFLEGEGYFAHQGVGKQLLIGADSTDLDVIEHAASIMKCKVYGPYPNGVSVNTGLPHKNKWRVQVTNSVAAGWMMTLYPLLASRRRGKIRESLAVWRQQPVTRKKRTHCIRGGHPLSGDNLYVNPRGERSCKLCFKPASRLARKMLPKINERPASCCQ